MDLLDLLRGLTLATRLLLAAALLVLVSGRAVRLEQNQWRCWLVIAVVFTVVAFDNAVLEALVVATRGLPDDAPVERVADGYYNATYLLHAVLSAAAPAALIGLTGVGRARAGGWLVAGSAVVIGVVAAAGGALGSWDRLLDSTRVLAFIGVPAHLAFLGLVLLRQLDTPDRYLVWFVAVRALFVVLTPIQEVFFQVVGREESRHLWHLSQSLQFATGVAHVVIVLRLLRALGGGRVEAAPAVMRPAGEAGARP